MQIHFLAFHLEFCRSTNRFTRKLHFFSQNTISMDGEPNYERNYLEPFNGGSQKSWEHFFNITDIIDLAGFWIIYIDGVHFPVRFAFIDQCNDAKNFNLQHFTTFRNAWSNFEYINRIIITFAAGRWVCMLGIFPCLRECTIIPDVTMMWKTVGDITQFPFLHILFDWIECFR